MDLIFEGIVKKICDQCGTEFEARWVQQLRCSPDCVERAKDNRYYQKLGREAPKHVKSEPRNCVWCDSSYVPVRYDQKYCGQECRDQYSSSMRKENPEVSRRHRLKKLFGITPREFDFMVAVQGNRCAICSETSTKRLEIDHDHVTGKVRGLLCEGCNKAIGRMKDDPGRLLAGAAYLVSHQMLNESTTERSREKFNA